jgi:methylated-DNA-[protein]-cysteine S-methyltransferase
MCKDEYGPVLTSVIEAGRALSDCDYQNGNWERHFVRNDRSSTLKIAPNDSHLQLLVDRIETPIGEMLIVADRDGNLRATFWTDREAQLHDALRRQYGENGFTLEPASNPHGLTNAIGRYFAGELTAIDSLPVKTAGTPFQREVWRALREISCGTTLSYGTLAARIGRPNAMRAVGLANGSNPVGVVVPCHRVIGSDGSLTGYGGGIERKRWLLEHESKHAVFRLHG